MMVNQPDCCLVMSDLHAGSIFGLMRPGFSTLEGNAIGLNPFQDWLWEQFESCLEEVDKLADGRKFLTVFNGDLIEGNHHKTKELMHVDANEHIRMAEHIIRPILDRSSLHAIVEGTECHTGDLEAKLGAATNAMQCPSTHLPVFRELPIEINGCYGLFRHHMPTTARMYLEASGMGIDLGNSQLSYARIGQRVPQFICSAHRHRPGIYSDGQALYVVTPCWQGLGRWARKVVIDGKITPGLAWLDWRGKAAGELPDAKLIVRKPLPRTIVRI